MHSNLRRRVDGVVGVGLVARVHAALEGLAGHVKRGLSGGVVLAEEGEDDGITDGSGELGRVELEALGAADRNAVSGAGTGRSDGSCVARGSGLGGRSSGGSGVSVDRGRYCDGGGLVDDSGSGAATEVNPEEVDLDVRTRIETEEPAELRDLIGRCLDAIDLLRDRVPVPALEHISIPSPAGIDIIDCLCER